MERDWICGVDEVGRGPWAGPVCAGAVILSPDRPIDGLADSKVLTERKRETLSAVIRERAAAWSLGWASPQEIDALNIRNATHLAMVRAVHALFHPVDQILVDGSDVPPALPKPAMPIIRGDRSVPAISAAAIVAKVARDALLKRYEIRYPGYGFTAHKGYGTAEHKAALDLQGPCPAHRLSFKPVAAVAQAMSA